MDAHASEAQRAALLDRASHEPVALVSDAGTPLISDPGQPLVHEARARGIPVTTAPGPCAAIAALSIAGLPTDRFFFAGFLPPKAAAREQAVESLAAIPGTLVFHETGPRLSDTLACLARILGPREAAIAHELTKRFEEVKTGPLDHLAAEAAAGPPPRGEIVLLVGPATAAEAPDSSAVDEALVRALARMAPGKAAASVAQAFGIPRGPLYARALALSKP
jgi:16S rRNA (cytidine1402-2'-O)-methyltransferase